MKKKKYLAVHQLPSTLMSSDYISCYTVHAMEGWACWHFWQEKKSFKFLFTPSYYSQVGFCAITDLEDQEDILGLSQSPMIPVSVFCLLFGPRGGWPRSKGATRPSWLQLLWDLETQELQLQVWISAWTLKDLCSTSWCRRVQKHLSLCQPTLSTCWAGLGKHP